MLDKGNYFQYFLVVVDCRFRLLLLLVVGAVVRYVELTFKTINITVMSEESREEETEALKVAKNVHGFSS